MEFGFYQYLVNRQVHGYTFEQAVNTYLADDNISPNAKQTEWVNTARNYLITQQVNLNTATQVAYNNAQVAYNNAQIAYNNAQIGAQIGN